MHVRYDTVAFWELLASVKFLPKGMTRSIFLATREECWKMFTNYTKYETKLRKYGFSFTTDGVSASLHMEKPAKDGNQLKVKKIKLEA